MVVRQTEHHLSCRNLFLGLVLAAGLSGGVLNVAKAGLAFDGIADGSGTGIGGALHVLSIQANGIERGCLGSDGTPSNGDLSVLGIAGCDVAGPSATTTGRAENSSGGLRQVSLICDALGTCATRSSQMRLVFLPAQTAQGPITLDDLVFKIYDSAGQLAFWTRLSKPIFSLASSNPGPAGIGFVFRLDNLSELAASVPLLFSNPANYFIAIQASVTDGSGGAERFFITTSEALGVEEIPERLHTDGFETAIP